MQIRSVFDDITASMLEASFEPIPDQVCEWLDGADVGAWRDVVQRARRIEDRDFFLRFIPSLHRRRVRLEGLC
jgi:hypothetical protein